MIIEKIIIKLREFYNLNNKTLMDRVSEKEDPFKVLIACIISQRTKDETTDKITEKLFKKVKNPYDLYKIEINELEKIIYPSGFYRVKAKRLKELSKILIDNYNGLVPDTLDELLKLPQVGRKTANIVLTKGYKKSGIAVDTHVHRIVNRLGIVKTKRPEETEMELKKIVPEKYWIELNDYLVNFGKIICKPISPKCPICPIEKYCKKINVKKFR
ncbi:MAG: endonuclease III [Caldisericia bacterium]|nr:endonuclease III [Caldisericia bacterium]